MNKLSFVCKFGSENLFEYEIDNTIAIMISSFMDEDEIKLFFVLLRESVDQLKNKGCTVFRQYVTPDDWDNYLQNNSKWRIVECSEFYNNVLIECNIDDALSCIGDGLGYS